MWENTLWTGMSFDALQVAPLASKVRPATAMAPAPAAAAAATGCCRGCCPAVPPKPPRWAWRGDMTPDRELLLATLQLQALAPPGRLLMAAREGGAGAEARLRCTPADRGIHVRVHGPGDRQHLCGQPGSQ